MKILKCTVLVLVFSVLFAGPCRGWSVEPVKKELQPVVEEIQALTKKEKSIDQIKNAPLIVAIGGCPGVGKSTIAQLLCTELAEAGIVSAIVSLDHYGLPQSERKQFASELDPRRIRWDKLHETLVDIRSSKIEIVKPTINQLTKEIGEERLCLEGVDCILFEGMYALADFKPMDFLQYADLGIYLEASLENIFAWKWERELKKASPRTPEAFFHHMIEIVRDFAFHVYPTRKNADYVIHTDFVHRYSVTCDAALKTRPEPDFTQLRLKALAY